MLFILTDKNMHKNHNTRERNRQETRFGNNRNYSRFCGFFRGIRFIALTGRFAAAIT